MAPSIVKEREKMTKRCRNNQFDEKQPAIFKDKKVNPSSLAKFLANDSDDDGDSFLLNKFPSLSPKRLKTMRITILSLAFRWRDGTVKVLCVVTKRAARSSTTSWCFQLFLSLK
jgi:hypothetical protein